MKKPNGISELSDVNSTNSYISRHSFFPFFLSNVVHVLAAQNAAWESNVETNAKNGAHKNACRLKIEAVKIDVQIKQRIINSFD